MSSAARYRECLLAGIALGTLACEAPARAADIELPVKAPYLQPVFDWTGSLYRRPYRIWPRLFQRGAVNPPSAAVTNSIFGGLIGGVQGGYNSGSPRDYCSAPKPTSTFPNYI